MTNKKFSSIHVWVYSLVAVAPLVGVFLAYNLTHKGIVLAGSLSGVGMAGLVWAVSKHNKTSMVGWAIFIAVVGSLAFAIGTGTVLPLPKVNPINNPEFKIQEIETLPEEIVPDQFKA